MKQSLTFILILFLSPAILFSQQITGLSIQKPLKENYDHRTSITFFIPLDLTGFDINNPFDKKLSEISLFKDDSGKDLLKAHQLVMDEKGYEESIIGFYGVHDYQNNKDIDMTIEVLSSPASGATKLFIEGKIVLNFAGSGEEKTAKLENVPVEIPYDSPGFESPLGLVKLEGSGSVGYDDVDFLLYRLLATDVSILKVEATDGPAGAAYEELKSLGVGIEGNEIPFKNEVPETVDITVTYSEIEQKEVPINLEFPIGF